MLRRTFLAAVLATGSAALTRSSAAFGAGEAVPADPLTVDFHSHAWRRADFAADLRRGGVSLTVMVATSDRLLLTRETGRWRALGTVAPGALHANATGQIAAIAQLIADNELATVRTPSDVHKARMSAKPGILLGFEGADVLEGNLERLPELYATGVRLIQLVHYRVNELGDIQTEDPVHSGLTSLGADTVRICNRLGIIVDVAHATLDVTRQTAKVATRPLLLSHTYLRDSSRRYTRGITRDHALIVAETEGLIGVVPFPNVFTTLEDYSEGIARMVDAAGVDHVGIGGDLAGIIGKPPYRRFEQFPHILEMLRRRGLGNEDVIKIAGGNFMRLFAAVTART